MDYLIGLDIGTSSVKGVLLTVEGQVVKSSRGAFAYKQVGEAGLELVAEEYLAVCLSTIKELASSATDGEVKGVCASSASGNLLLLDEDHKPATGIIGWQDRRVTEEAKDVLGDLDIEAFYDCIGWRFSFKTFPLAQLCYIKKHNPKLLEQCSAVCMSTEYLYYELTGKWGISTSAGTPFYLIDQKKGQYIDELLARLEISPEKVPPILPCGQMLGGIKKEIADACGLPEGTPVVLGSFDHPSAARGVGVLKEGQMLLSCGTSWVTFLPVADREKAIRGRTLVDPFLSEKGGCWAVMSSLASLSGKIYRYVERYIDDSADAFSKLSKLCAQSQSGANGLVINLLEEPVDEVITKYTKQDIARAIMEGTVLLLKNKLDILKEKGFTADSAIMVGGPSEDPMWRTLIEEICHISVQVKHASYAGAVGAAVLAGIGVGIYENEEEAQTRFNKEGE